MSADNVKLRVKIGLNEVEIEGSVSNFEKAISLIPEVLRSLPEESFERQAAPPATLPSHSLETFISRPPPATGTPSAAPEIHLEKGDSLSDIIVKLFKDPWGSRPRRLGEVREVLESYGQVYPKQSVAVALLRLAQSGRLRRFKGDGGEYVYTASTALAVEDAGRLQPAVTQG